MALDPTGCLSLVCMNRSSSDRQKVHVIGVLVFTQLCLYVVVINGDAFYFKFALKGAAQKGKATCG